MRIWRPSSRGSCRTRFSHAGDAEGGEDYIEAVCDCPLEIVRGNCDFGSTLPAEVVLGVGNHVVLLTPWASFRRRIWSGRPGAEARNKDADVVIYGHTHCPQITYVDDIAIVNPGSISYPRQEEENLPIWSSTWTASGICITISAMCKILHHFREIL